MNAQKFSVGESLSFGWEGMKKHFWFFFVLLISSFIAYLVMRVFPVGDKTHVVSRNMTIVGYAVLLVGLLFSVCVNIATTKAQLAVVDGKMPSFAFLAPKPLLWLKLFLAYILVSIIKIVGYVLLIIPGIYFKIRLQFVFYAVIEHGYWPFKAIGHSWEITRGHEWDLLLLNITSFGVNLLGVLGLVVGVFASVPTTLIAHAHVYRKLSR